MENGSSSHHIPGSSVSFAGCVEQDENGLITNSDMIGSEVKIPIEVARIIGLGVGALRSIIILMVLAMRHPNTIHGKHH